MGLRKILFFVFIILVLTTLIGSSLALPTSFTVRETDFVKIEAESIDLDGDNVVYYYSAPLNENGEWQTGYDDEGVYDIEITASDGINQVVKEIELIVQNRNQAPYLSDNKISSKETQVIDLKKLIVDPDEDPLEYSFEEPFDSNGKWETGYDDESTFVTDIEFSDGEFSEKNRIEVTVLKTNQPPVILSLFEEDKIVTGKEGEDLDFYVDVIDSDDDEMTITWSYDNEIISERASGDFDFDYEQKGEHTLMLVISDGITEVVKEWTVKVEGTNRKPQLSLLPVSINEGEGVYLDLPDVDLDGDLLTYSFEAPLNSEGEWQTNYEDSGVYKLKIIASDGKLKDTEYVDIEILNVDRSPVLKLPEELNVYEDETLEYTFDAIDLDGDSIEFSFNGLPANALFEDRTITWQPGYDYIKRRGGLISNLLNTMRIEDWFLKSRSFMLDVTACSKEKCVTESTKIIVGNVNRKPGLEIIGDNVFTETELVELSYDAVDPDGDIVRVYFTNPLEKRSGSWQTDYDDEGIYTSYVTATDGNSANTIPVNIEVEKKNREPSLHIQKDVLTVNEGQEFMFEVTASDPDDDELTIKLDNPPMGASFSEGVFLWAAPHNTVVNRSDRWLDDFVSNFDYWNKKFSSEKATVWLNFVASDGSVEVVHPVKVIVKNVNVKPEILDFIPVNEFNLKTGEPTVFHVTAKDADNDRLEYKWDFGLRQTSVKGTDTITRTFTSPGKKSIEISIDDGRDKVEKEWDVVVAKEKVVVSSEPVKKDPFTVRVYVIEGK